MRIYDWLRRGVEQIALGYRMLLAPWPPFTVAMVLIAIAGGLMPLGRIAAIRTIVDLLVAGGGDRALDLPLMTIIGPYVVPLLWLVGLVVLDRTVYYEPFHKYLAAQLYERVREQFDEQIFRRSLGTPLIEFEQSSYHDALARARAALDDNIPNRLGHLQTIVALIPSCVVIIFSLGAVHWALALVLLFGSSLLLQRHVAEAREVVATAAAQTTLERRQRYWASLLTERAPAAEVRLFGLQGHFVDNWRSATERSLAALRTTRQQHERRTTATALLISGINGAVLLALLLAAFAGRVGAGELVALLFAIQQYLDQIERLSGKIAGQAVFIERLRHVAAFIALPTAERTTGDPAPALDGDGLRCTGVGFTYPGNERPALHGITLHIRPGERIALVGANGAGKSTLVKLMLGLYTPTAGRITADGIDLQTIAPQAWRTQTSAVLQDFTRYPLTVRENIGLGRLEALADANAIDQAALRSGASDVIATLPAGIDTLIDKTAVGGVDLSGGQWQKLALARAYLRGGKLLIFDEPASALDPLAEREVYRQFLALGAERTVILISHRLGSARLADRIIVLDGGRISETGTHEALMAAGGGYAALYRLQAEWYGEDLRT